MNFPFGIFDDLPGFSSHAHFRGHHHHMHNHEEESEEEKMATHCKILGVEPSASPAQLKKAYRKLALEHHPDRGGDEQIFKEIQHAYEELSDPDKRPNTGGHRRRKRKGEDVFYKLPVTLEDLYNGRTKRLKVTKNVVCGICGGEGHREGADAKKRCSTCHGRGYQIVRTNFGGFGLNAQRGCDTCEATGFCVAPEDLCGKCRGNKVVKETQSLNVYIEKGMSSGKKITFKGEADQSPDCIPGDVVVVLQEQKHETYSRKGQTLTIHKEISLLEALNGVSITFRHLDGRQIRMESPKGEVVSPGDVKVLEGEGMPEYKNPLERGSLFVKFTVKFPTKDSLTRQKRKMLDKALGDCFLPSLVNLSDEVETATLTDFDPVKERMKAEETERRESRRDPSSDDDEDMYEDGNVACATQ